MIDWWVKWYNADMLERLQMVEKLIVVETIKESKGFGEHRDKIIAQLLNSYFEDLVDFMESK